MKKQICSVVFATTILATNICEVRANNIGDVVGETLFTDIVASINNINIPSYNYNDYTMIVAEDLRNYGFNVEWDQTNRTLSIERDTSTNKILSTYVDKHVSKDILGTKSHDVLYTDIRTFIQGREVTSHNLGGMTIINFEDLYPYGDIIYNNSTRTIDLTISDGLQFKAPSVVANVLSTNTTNISNWASISPVQQFKYMDEGLAYAYRDKDILNIVTPRKKLQIDAKYPLLGDVISDDDGNFYIIWGKANENNTYDTETVFISKYSENGRHIKTTGFVGESSMGESGNTKVPFEFGNCDSAIANGCLMVNYARKMYNGHQSNNVIGVYLDDMSAVKFDGKWDIPYTSHSFNQRIIWSNIANDFIYADHGDAYSRAFVITTGAKEKSIFKFYLESNANYNMYIVNKTFAQLGGLLETSDGVVLVGASAKSISEKAKEEKQNLFVQIFDPTSEKVSRDMFVGGEDRSGATSLDINDNQNSPLTPVTDYGVHWITDYTDRDVVAPHSVVADDKIVILWNEYKAAKQEAFYTVLSSDGNILTPVTSLGEDKKLNSNEDPIYHDGAVYWACAYNGTIQVMSINL